MHVCYWSPFLGWHAVNGDVDGQMGDRVCELHCEAKQSKAVHPCGDDLYWSASPACKYTRHGRPICCSGRAKKCKQREAVLPCGGIEINISPSNQLHQLIQRWIIEYFPKSNLFPNLYFLRHIQQHQYLWNRVLEKSEALSFQIVRTLKNNQGFFDKVKLG